MTAALGLGPKNEPAARQKKTSVHTVFAKTDKSIFSVTQSLVSLLAQCALRNTLSFPLAQTTYKDTPASPSRQQGMKKFFIFSPSVSKKKSSYCDS